MLDENELMDQDETAALLRTNRNTLAQQRFRGSGPRFVKRGRMVYYFRSSVEEWLRDGERNQTDGGRASRPAAS